jgi:hypothetical protein
METVTLMHTTCMRDWRPPIYTLFYYRHHRINSNKTLWLKGSISTISRPPKSCLDVAGNVYERENFACWYFPVYTMYIPPLSPARSIYLTSCNNFPSRLSPYILYSSSELFVGWRFINPIKMGCNLYQVEGSDIRVRCCSGVLGEESTFFIGEMRPKCWKVKFNAIRKLHCYENDLVSTGFRLPL